MRRLSIFLFMIFFITSCSMFGGSDGYFPEKKYDFLEEKVEGDVLFSPGHPSGEDFQNFEIRGNSFKEKVNEYFS